MNRMLDWLGGFGRKLDFGLQGLGQELWKIGSLAFRLAMVFLFFWYFTEAIGILLVHHPFFASVVVLVGISVVCVFLIVLVHRSQLCEVELGDRTENGKVLPFLLLNLPFIFAVEFKIGCTTTHSPTDSWDSRRSTEDPELFFLKLGET